MFQIYLCCCYWLLLLVVEEEEEEDYLSFFNITSGQLSTFSSFSSFVYLSRHTTQVLEQAKGHLELHHLPLYPNKAQSPSVLTLL